MAEKIRKMVNQLLQLQLKKPQKEEQQQQHIYLYIYKVNGRKELVKI